MNIRENPKATPLNICKKVCAFKNGLIVIGLEIVDFNYIVIAHVSEWLNLCCQFLTFHNTVKIV